MQADRNRLCRSIVLILRPERLTGTGLLVTFSGGSLGGEIRSRRLRHSVTYAGCKSTIIAASPAFLRGAGLKNSLTLSAKLLSSPSRRKTCCLALRGTLMDRSVRKSFRLPQKLGAISCG